jgi:predicted anti-sigma-YlaC factor YlaD
MNHQYFKDWLLSEDPLTSDQTDALQEHLQTCDTCRQLEAAWSEVHLLFQNDQEVDPKPDFTERWLKELNTQQLKRQKRMVWIVFGVTVGIAGLLLFLLSYQAFDLLSSPTQLVLIGISRVVYLLSLLYATSDILQVLTNLVPKVSPAVFVLFTGMVSFLSVLWFVTYKQLITNRRLLK